MGRKNLAVRAQFFPPHQLTFLTPKPKTSQLSCPPLHLVHGEAVNNMNSFFFLQRYSTEYFGVLFPFPALTLYIFLFPQQVTSGNGKSVNMESK